MVKSKFMEYLLEDASDPAGTLRVMYGMCLSFFGDVVQYLGPKCPKETLETIDKFISSLQKMRKVTEELAEKPAGPPEIEGYKYVGGVSFEDILNLSPEEIAEKLPEDSMAKEERLAAANEMKKISGLIQRLEDCDSEEEQNALLVRLNAYGNDTKH